MESTGWDATATADQLNKMDILQTKDQESEHDDYTCVKPNGPMNQLSFQPRSSKLLPNIR